MVALAVGNLLAVLGFAAGVSEATHAAWRDHGEDVKVTSEGGRPLDGAAARLMRTTPGVAAVDPMFVTDISVGGEEAFFWSVRRQTMFRYRVAQGRWFTADEEQGRARVAVAERNIARATGLQVGNRVQVDTAGGPVTLRIVGISANQQENGAVLFVPITTARDVLGSAQAAANDYWVKTETGEHRLVERVTTRLEDTLTAAGYQVATEIEYVDEADNVAANRTITTSIAVLGFLIVAISMVGLANTVTMNVIERTREIGVMRCIGARGRDVRRIFATEGLVLALAGWLLGIPIGFLLDCLLVWLLKRVLNVDVPVAFPLSNVVLALVGTLLISLVIMILPLRRAVRSRPGDALRYA
jgi:putative ABC transport system permease protein